MLKIKCDINQQDLKRVDLHVVKSDLQMSPVTLKKYDFFHPLEVLDRVSETQLQVSEN